MEKRGREGTGVLIRWAGGGGKGYRGGGCTLRSLFESVEDEKVKMPCRLACLSEVYPLILKC